METLLKKDFNTIQIKEIYEIGSQDKFLVNFLKRLDLYVKKLEIEDSKIFDDIKKDINDFSYSIAEKLEAIKKVGVNVEVSRSSKFFSMDLSSNILGKELKEICSNYTFNDYLFTEEDIEFTEKYLIETRNTNVEKKMLSPAEAKYNDWDSLNRNISYYKENYERKIKDLKYENDITFGFIYTYQTEINKYRSKLEDVEKEIRIGKELKKNKDKFDSFLYQELEKIFDYYNFIKNNWDKYISIRETLKELEVEFNRRIQTRYVRALVLMNNIEPSSIKDFELVTEKFYKIYRDIAQEEKKVSSDLDLKDISLNSHLFAWLNYFVGSNLILKADNNLENNESELIRVKLLLSGEKKEYYHPTVSETKHLYLEICKDKQLYNFLTILSIYYKELEEKELRLPKDLDIEINKISVELLRKEKLLNEHNIDVDYVFDIPAINHCVKIEDNRLNHLYNVLEFNGLFLKEQDIEYIKNHLKSNDDETKKSNLTLSFEDEASRLWDETQPIMPLVFQKNKLENKINKLEKKKNKKIILNIRKKHLEKREKKLSLKKQGIEGELAPIIECNENTRMFNSLSDTQFKLILDYLTTVKNYQARLHSLEDRWLEHISNFNELSKTRWERALERMTEALEFSDEELIERMKLRVLKICYMKAIGELEKSNEDMGIELNPESVSWFCSCLDDNSIAKLNFDDNADKTKTLTNN